MEIGRRLKEAREAIGYTLEKASEKSGISAPTINAYEHCGTPTGREPKFSQLSKLAEVYRKTIEFFFTDEPTIENAMLWRDTPDTEEQMKETEAEFQQLCEQYHKLELITGEKRSMKLPQPDVDKPAEFHFPQAESFARRVKDDLCLGDIPSMSLKRILEERFYVKIFHLNFSGSAISIKSQFGLAILLNSANKLWRRNYDLAHELFHILTWDIFRKTPKSFTASADEEKLANAFASVLLMPEDSFKKRIESRMDEKGQISLDQLDDIAREFEVSLDALVYRIANLFRIEKEDTTRYLEAAKKLAQLHKPRESDKPEKLPERYCDLAQRALREGKLSLMQFAKYMGLSYKKAQDYIMEDEDFTDEKISISVA